MAKHLVLIRNLNGKVKYMVFENKDIAEHYAHKQDASNCAETLELDEEI